MDLQCIYFTENERCKQTIYVFKKNKCRQENEFKPQLIYAYILVLDLVLRDETERHIFGDYNKCLKITTI